jgi:hypothetical protein
LRLLASFERRGQWVKIYVRCPGCRSLFSGPRAASHDHSFGDFSACCRGPIRRVDNGNQRWRNDLSSNCEMKLVL